MTSRTLTAALVLLAACIQVYPPGSQPAPAGAPAQAPGAAATKPAEPKDPFKPWDSVLKDTRPIEGMVRTHVGKDLSLYFELKPDQLDRDLGLVLHISRGVGDLELHQGLPLSDGQLIRFHRSGSQVHLLRLNPRFRADSGTPMQRSVEGNQAPAVVAVFKIESEHKETKALLINATPFLLSDYPDLAEYMKFFYRGKTPSFNKERSVVGRVQGFPRNVEIDAELTFVAPGFPAFGNDAALADYRTIPVSVRYSFYALPEQPMRARHGDDRVGYFLDAVYDFSRDRKAVPYRTMVNRWRLEKKDPAAAVSEPVQPIVYYIDRTVPVEYRQYVKEGIEAWNKGFEAAGFRNAIVARDAPDDSTWSAEDVRYSTVRWSAAYRMGYAIGPSQTDPRTGEILNADILISAVFPRGWLFDWQELASPEAMRAQALRLSRPELPGRAALAGRACLQAAGLSHQLGVQHALLAGLGVLGDADSVPMRYVGEALRELIMHEVGHTLGLRHNFKSSSGVPNARLTDTAFTRRNGVAVSVMDYAPANIASDPARQGHFYNNEVGSYDVWAIKYGYVPIPGATSSDAELPELARIAGQSAEPLLTYGTDEDNWLGPYAVDPQTSAWELGEDPVKWAADRVALVKRVEPALERRLIRSGDGYQRLRGAITSLLFERYSALYPVTKTVGGLAFTRDHKGAPNARPPFTPVPAERQRAAVALITESMLSEQAIRYEPELLNRLAPNRLSHWGTGYGATPVEFPANEMVGSLQELLLTDLLEPIRVARMINNESRVAAGQAYTAAEMFRTLTDAIWSELDTPARPRAVHAVRRNLQRNHIGALGRMLLPGPVGPVLSEDARSLARLELEQVAARIRRADQGAVPDAMTRAHLAENLAQITRLLEATVALPGTR